MRILSWFSCGAASAVASKMAIKIGEAERVPVEVVYCQVIEEHPDNLRFLVSCESWLGREIKVLKSEKYSGSIYRVFEETRYLKGPKGARCSVELKRRLRHEYQRPEDRHVFGFTAEEQHRADRLDVDCIYPLIDEGLTKQDCLAIVTWAGIELPMMYQLGYKNANCVGCVRGEAGYWNKIRVDFPLVFERMSRMEEKLGRTVCKIERQVNGKRTLRRVPLRELPPDAGRYEAEMDVECGVVCESAARGLEE